MKRPLLLSVSALLLVLFALFVWPTPYRYLPSPGQRVLAVRLNRITQAVDYCTPDGWESASFTELTDPAEFADPPAAH